MKISIESYGKKYTTETERDDLSISEHTEILINLLISIGFSRETIINDFKEVE